MQMNPKDKADLEAARQVAFRCSKALHVNDINMINCGLPKFSRDLLAEFHLNRKNALITIREILDKYRNPVRA
jgi:hypothetical protein